MQPSLWQLLIVAALVLILFGRGRISEMMGDVGKGIKSFKQGVTDDGPKDSQEPKRIDSNTNIQSDTQPVRDSKDKN